MYAGFSPNLWNPILLNSDSSNFYFLIDKFPTIGLPTNEDQFFKLIPQELVSIGQAFDRNINFHFQHKDFPKI